MKFSPPLLKLCALENGSACCRLLRTPPARLDGGPFPGLKRPSLVLVVRIVSGTVVMLSVISTVRVTACTGECTGILFLRTDESCLDLLGLMVWRCRAV